MSIILLDNQSANQSSFSTFQFQANTATKSDNKDSNLKWKKYTRTLIEIIERQDIKLQILEDRNHLITQNIQNQIESLNKMNINLMQKDQIQINQFNPGNRKNSNQQSTNLSQLFNNLLCSNQQNQSSLNVSLNEQSNQNNTNQLYRGQIDTSLYIQICLIQNQLQEIINQFKDTQRFDLQENEKQMIKKIKKYLMHDTDNKSSVDTSNQYDQSSNISRKASQQVQNIISNNLNYQKPQNLNTIFDESVGLDSYKNNNPNLSPNKNNNYPYITANQSPINKVNYAQSRKESFFGDILQTKQCPLSKKENLIKIEINEQNKSTPSQLQTSVVYNSSNKISERLLTNPIRKNDGIQTKKGKQNKDSKIQNLEETVRESLMTVNCQIK